MGRRLGVPERKSEKQAVASRANAAKARLSRWMDPAEQAKLDDAKADLRSAMVAATPRICTMLRDPKTPPGLLIELWKLVAPKVGLTDRIEQAITMPDIPPLVVVVGTDETTQ